MAEVTIFANPNFQGQAQALPKGRYNDALHQMSLANDSLSSIKVPQGLVARLYHHAHFQGPFIDIRQDTPVMTSFWNDQTSSIVVYEESDQPPITREVVIFQHRDYSGNSQILQKGQYGTPQILIGDNSLSSAMIPYGMVVRLYEGPNFQGESIELRDDTPVINLEWNDRVSSIVVDEAPVSFWKVSNTSAGVIGESSAYNGVRGISHASHHAGVFALNDSTGPGVVSVARQWHGVYGETESTGGGAGVWGEHKTGGTGVAGHSKDGRGVFGYSDNNHAVWGESPKGSGIVGIAKQWHGVYGETASTVGGAGVWGEHKSSGPGVLGVSNSGIGIEGRGGRLAGYFQGDVEVTGDIRLANADCAEDFDICETQQIEPGTVMVLGEEGKLEPSQKAYDKRVAGVVSGAGSYKPGIVLDKQQSKNTRKPIALLGKVFCKVDALHGAIEIGDLLTTSPTPGHAMKAHDPAQAFGTVIGKALRPFAEGQGLIPILIALQ